MPWALGLLAEAETASGRADAALRVLDEALELVSRTGERMNEAELHRLRGRALLAAARPAEARVALEVALATAERQGAVLSARWAADDLRLQRPPGDRTERRVARGRGP